MTDSIDTPDVRNVLARLLHDRGCMAGAECRDSPTTWVAYYADADAVLAAVTPGIRRRVAEEIAEAIDAEVSAANWAKTFRNGLDHAAGIARSHSTPEVQDHD